MGKDIHRAPDLPDKDITWVTCPTCHSTTDESTLIPDGCVRCQTSKYYAIIERAIDWCILNTERFGIDDVMAAAAAHGTPVPHRGIVTNAFAHVLSVRMMRAHQKKKGIR